MSERVARFLISLSQDPYKLDRFLDDPDPVLADSDLTSEEKEVVRGGDPEQIRASLGELGSMATSTSSTTGSPSGRPPGRPPGPPPGPPPGGGGNNNPGKP